MNLVLLFRLLIHMELQLLTIVLVDSAAWCCQPVHSECYSRKKSQTGNPESNASQHEISHRVFVFLKPANNAHFTSQLTDKRRVRPVIY